MVTTVSKNLPMVVVIAKTRCEARLRSTWLSTGDKDYYSLLTVLM